LGELFPKSFPNVSPAQKIRTHNISSVNRRVPVHEPSAGSCVAVLVQVEDIPLGEIVVRPLEAERETAGTKNAFSILTGMI